MLVYQPFSNRGLLSVPGRTPVFLLWSFLGTEGSFQVLTGISARDAGPGGSPPWFFSKWTIFGHKMLFLGTLDMPKSYWTAQKLPNYPNNFGQQSFSPWGAAPPNSTRSTTPMLTRVQYLWQAWKQKKKGTWSTFVLRMNNVTWIMSGCLTVYGGEFPENGNWFRH